MLKPECEVIRLGDSFLNTSSCTGVCYQDCGVVCLGADCDAECVNYDPLNCPYD